MKRFVLPIAVLLAVAASPLAAQANVGVRLEAPAVGQVAARMEVAANDRLIPLPQVIARLQHQSGGQYVSADVVDQGGRTVYWVRMRQGGGRFIDYVVDAQTGQIISQQGG
jgi:uncharacterized membrane protein YkoI